MAKKPSENNNGKTPSPSKNNGGIQKSAARKQAPSTLQKQALAKAQAGGSGFWKFFTPVTELIKGLLKDDTLPTPGVNYLIEDLALEVLLQIRPRIPDRILNSGTFLTWIVEPTEDDYQRIQRYFQNSKSRNKAQIKNILRITRIGDLEPNGLEHGPKKMLFHGTKVENIGSILNTGFLPEKSVCGKGMFFADRVDKSLGFCGMEGSGWLFLCEVFLGRAKENKIGKGGFDLPWSYNSIVWKGSMVPNEAEDVLVFGCVWPVGKTVKSGSRGRYHSYSEYIVYRREQVRPKFLIQWETMQ